MPNNLKVDIVIVTQELLALRNFPIWEVVKKRMQPLIESSTLRVAMPQDDYTMSESLDRFLVDCKFTHVFTPLTRDLDQIYPNAINADIKFEEALTGYFEADHWDLTRQFVVPFREREIDLGQRVVLLSPHFGMSANRKGRIAIEMAKMASQRGFTCDVSTDPNEVFIGNEWWKFLGNIRYTISRKGGASIADPRGYLGDRARRLELRYPNISYEELAKKLKIATKKEGDFSAISPRLFEASAMGVCQILDEDEYIGEIEPWVHYIPLKNDFENIDEVIRAMGDFEKSESMANAAATALISSGRYTYEFFVKEMLKKLDCLVLPKSLGLNLSDLDEVQDEIIKSKRENLRHVQDYVRRCYLARKSKMAITALKAGALFRLGPYDDGWFEPTKENCESMMFWIEAFTTNNLLAESLTFPWRSAIGLAHIGNK
jgi:hypothetical protein